MTPSELKRNVEETGSFFFSRKTMKFFGDTMKNYGVRQAVIMDTHNITKEVYELYRKKPVKMGRSESTFFDRKTFRRVFKKAE